MVAGLLLAGRRELLRTLSVTDLWHATETPIRVQDATDVFVERHLNRLGLAATAVRHQPIRVAFDALSPLNRRRAGLSEDGGGYIISVVRSIQSLWTLSAGLYKHRLTAAAPAQWIALKAGYDATIDHVFDVVAEPAVEKDKGRMLNLVSLPQLICVGMPLLERVRQVSRARWQGARRAAEAAGHDPDTVKTVQQLYRDYARWAEIRLAVGVFIADGLRTSNYRFGCLGRHIAVILTRGADGRANGVHAVRATFDGEREDTAKTKREVARGTRRRRSLRVRNVRPGPLWRSALVPLDALWEYLVDVTLPRAKNQESADPLPPDADVEALVASGCYPLFIARSKKGKHRGRPMSPNTLSIERVGFALWWTAYHALGRDVARDFKALDRKGVDARIFSGHCTRLLISMFWGKVMGDWEYAATMTNDHADTLKEFYSVDLWDKWEDVSGDPSHWDHPKAYTAWMQAIREQRLDAVDLRDPALPLPESARRLLDDLESPLPRERQGRAARGRHIRRARIGQQPPAQPVADDLDARNAA